MHNGTNMTRLNVLHVFKFLGGLCLVIAGYIAWDIYIYEKEPLGSTISWSMSLLMYNSPLFSFFLGALVFSIPTGLVVHFVGGMMSPADWAKMQEMEAEIKQLQDELANSRRL
jgi:uncharacterized membrane protein (DUF106 family)